MGYGGAVEGFFEGYARAFDAFDEAGISAFFAAPCMIVESGGTLLLRDTEQVRANTAGILEHHRRSGYGRAEVVSVDVTTLGATLALAEVHWRIHHHDGSLLWDFRNTYNLTREDNGWRIRVSTTHQPEGAATS